MHLAAVTLEPSQTVFTAEQVLRGTLNLPGLEPASLTLPFAPHDLEHGLHSCS